MTRTRRGRGQLTHSSQGSGLLRRWVRAVLRYWWQSVLMQRRVPVLVWGLPISSNFSWRRSIRSGIWKKKWNELGYVHLGLSGVLTWSERAEPRSFTIWLRTTHAPLELWPWKSRRPSSRWTTSSHKLSALIFLQRTLERSLTREKRVFGSSFSALSLRRLTASTSWSATPTWTQTHKDTHYWARRLIHTSTSMTQLHTCMNQVVRNITL